MPTFTSFDGIELAFTDEGEGDPVLLLHGFAADSKVNWGKSGVPEALLASGRRVIRLDARGHGESDKPHDPAAYGDNAMARDVSALLDHLGLDRVDLVGYSMGALTSLAAAALEPRVRSAVLGGIGGNVTRKGAGGPLDRPAVAAALEADDPKTITDPSGRAFRSFADATGADRRALAAVQRSPKKSFGGLAAVDVPALVIVGDRDDLAGPADELAAALPEAKALTVSGDHLNAVLDPRFAEAVVAFLDERG